MHQNTPNYKYNANFGLLGLLRGWRGALGGQKVILPGTSFFWSKVCGPSGKAPYIYSRYQIWMVMDFNFDFWISH